MRQWLTLTQLIFDQIMKTTRILAHSLNCFHLYQPCQTNMSLTRMHLIKVPSTQQIITGTNSSTRPWLLLIPSIFSSSTSFSISQPPKHKSLPSSCTHFAKTPPPTPLTKQTSRPSCLPWFQTPFSTDSTTTQSKTQSSAYSCAEATCPTYSANNASKTRPTNYPRTHNAPSPNKP